MKKAEGMLGGEFARSQKNEQYFLVLTGWENNLLLKNHGVYVRIIMAEMYKRDMILNLKLK